MLPLIENWKLYLKNSESLSQNTVSSYDSDLKLLLHFLEKFISEKVSEHLLLNLDKQTIRSWILFRKNKGDSAKTISRGLSAVKNFLLYCIKEKLIEENDIIHMKSPRIQRSLPRPISIEKINEILSSMEIIKKTPWIIKRDKALLVLIYSVGLRISEALNLNRSDIENCSDFISVLGKGGKVRAVPIVPNVKKILLDYLNIAEFSNCPALFLSRSGKRLSASSVQKLMKQSRKLLNLPDSVTPHAFRHSCATHIIENGGDLRSVQELLGHSSISSTQIYSQIAKQYISDIYDKCHPLSKKQA